MSEVREKATLAKQAAAVLNNVTTDQKNDALVRMAERLVADTAAIIAANELDLQRGRDQGMSVSLQDRLALTPGRIESMAQALRDIAQLPDPIGDELDSFSRPNGIRIQKIRVPIGVVGMIYEARPNVTVDASALCLKTGNAVVLRGGSAALHTNARVVESLHAALRGSAVPADALQLIENADRSSVDEMLKLNGLLDVVIPRGGQSLITNVVMNATVPVIETGAGVCHTFVDASALPAMAESIAVNAKAQRPSVCNAMETLLVHAAYGEGDFARLAEALRAAGVEIRGCAETVRRLPWALPATAEDWGTEYNDYVVSLRIVSGLDEALAHIRQYGTMHSECIVTEDHANAERFLQEVDAAAVYHNASTRFTDGFEFGFGAEIGISTQKLHARGPMGLPALTSTKYRIYGNGQIRN
ncbi:gamma-glutamyl phosphate reductase [Paenibacillus swuensis]|uniref:Gamma-glutamyl phosphate reductase n=1 Tax=Paenibacillus swuensis TaxID=1178515 RepID=A0A172TLH4_9BACL|nr:glutamate-5-semialdehyde dehydrogenase [Paenibacillus swuensis]ANE47919.1 gamma-glutamyl phosphate reductase [Paenibacillus swuensis]